jgi:hypothetical protein
MPASTYELIKSGTITGNPTSFTLSAIPSGYTDLYIQCNFYFGGGFGGFNYGCHVNGGGGTAFATTVFGTAGSTVTVGDQNSVPSWLLSFPTGSNTGNNTGVVNVDIANYLNTNILKTVIIQTSVPDSTAPGIEAQVGVYNSTSAITSFTLLGNSGSTLAGGTVNIYGIKAE